MKVPFLDLNRDHDPLLKSFQKIFENHLRTGQFVLGEAVKNFENHFAAYLGSRHVVGLNSGTDALWFALKALNIGSGDEVITTALSFAGTAESILLSGATPVFIDVLTDSGLIDVSKIEEKITPKTKAIIPVHLFGNAVDMSALLSIAKTYKLHVVEDACQAHGTEYQGAKVGTLGTIGCFSFYPSKNLGAFGDGGALATKDPEVVLKVRQLANHGHSPQEEHATLGFNSRLDALQAGFLDAKLDYLDSWNSKRRKNASHYVELLKPISEIRVLEQTEHQKWNGHQMVVQLPIAKRDNVLRLLQLQGVEARIYYKTPMPHLKPFRSFAHGAFPNADRCSKSFLSLPLFPTLREEEVEFVVDQLKKAIG